MTKVEEVSRGQVSASAAEVYEEFFLPALFAQWAPVVAEAAAVAPGQQVLDVACGTGVLAREVAERTAPGGSVTGLDCNDGMLAVARRKRADISWVEGFAERLPFADRSFDTVVSQFGLMFFRGGEKALAEMWRVLRPGGRLAVAVCGRLEDAPGYATLVRLLDRLFGERAASEMRAPFALGEPAALRELFAQAGIPCAKVATQQGNARFASIEAWMLTDVKGWTLASLIDEAGYRRLLQAAAAELSPYAGTDGRVVFPFPANLATAVKPKEA